MFRLALAITALALLAVELAFSSALPAGSLPAIAAPGGGIQPEALVGPDGVLHVLYYQGDPARGDLFYVHSSDGGKTFTQPLRVNSQPDSAVAAGTIRGGQMALGKGGRPHVVWNGSSTAEPKGPPNPEDPANSPYSGLPMLYSRLNEAGDAFEPQRNLMRGTFGLDGGGTVAADSQGNVYVAWHAKAPGAAEGEAGRRVYLARSTDDGKSFSAERPISPESSGACGCCGMRLYAAEDGTLYGLFRTARDQIHRDVDLLVSRDHGQTFSSRRLQKWEINACPMTSMAFAEDDRGVAAAWETEGQVWWARLPASPDAPLRPVAAPGPAGKRKHPRLAFDPAGNLLMVWTEVPGWSKPGAMSWEVFGADGQALTASPQSSPLPVWSFAAPFWSGSGFAVIQ
ncbi:MAG: hypothetical protein GC160_01015 [Acidobacteria bacterium]|nr:hypothetical protein [Acidobacteriota bacterium]